jgi:hypothetical protein
MLSQPCVYMRVLFKVYHVQLAVIRMSETRGHSSQIEPASAVGLI